MDVEPYAKKRDLAVSNALQQAGISKSKTSGINCYTPRMKFAAVQGSPIYSLYTILEKVEQQTQTEPVETLPITYLELMIGLTAQEQDIANQAGAIETLPSAI